MKGSILAIKYRTRIHLLRCAAYFFFFTMPILLFTACAGGRHQEVMKIPLLKIENLTLARDVKEGMPLDKTTFFSTEDECTIAHLQIENISGERSLRWNWYNPKGELYLTSGDYPLEVSNGKYREHASVWHRLHIKGDRAENMPGAWRVDLFMGDDLIGSMGFTIEEDIDALPRIARAPDPKRWGLVIGIGEYKYLPPVDFADNDIAKINEYFRRVLGVPEGNLITLKDSEAAKGQIEGYLKSFFPRNMDKDSILYVYFAGHGAPHVTGGAGISHPYLMPYDADTRFIEQTGYNLEGFYDDLERIGAKRVYVFLDTCFSGRSARDEKVQLLEGGRPVLIDIKEEFLKSDKMIALSSSSGTEASHSYKEKGHGLFTYFLLSAMKGRADENNDNIIDLRELYNYIKVHVSMLSKKEKASGQTPSLRPVLDRPGWMESIEVVRFGD